MIGVQDFIGYYDWTFEYLRRNFGEQAVRDYLRDYLANCQSPKTGLLAWGEAVRRAGAAARADRIGVSGPEPCRI